jgi:subtilisin-like proprotein convertase family protein
MRTLYAFKNALTTCCLTALVALAAFGPASAQTDFGPFSASPALTITDNVYNGTTGSMVSSTVAVSGVTGTSVVNIEVDVDITHTWIGDLVVKLQSPDGDILTLVSRPGAAETADDGISAGGVGSSANLGGAAITFSDLSANDAELMGLNVTTSQSVCLNAGFCNFFPNPGASTHPTQTFASLFGGEMNGNWTLYLGDRAAGDVGTLNSWSIRISTVTPSLTAFVGVAVATDGDCSDDPLPATLNNVLNVAPGTGVCYFYYGENTGDVTLNLHDLQDDLQGVLLNGLPYALAPAASAYLATGPVVINSNTTSNATWTGYNAGPTDVAVGNAAAAVYIIPDNDDCAAAIALSCGDVVTGSTLGASEDGPAGDCVNPANSTAADVWYTVSGTGYNISASLCGSGYDTKIAVFTGDCGALVCVGGNDDAICSGVFSAQSEITFSSTLGVTYYIRVHGFGGSTGDYILTLECADCNGDFGGTATLDCNGVCSGGNTGVVAANSVTLDMTDQFDDGWNDATYQIYDNSDALNPVLILSGDLDNAASGDGTGIGQDILCLPNGCYLFTVGGGEYDEEIGWTLTGVDGGPLSGGAPESVAFSINTVSCDIAGCTDPEAVNYDPAATVSDGSCVFAPVNDLCSGAIAVSCGDVVSGTTIGASATDAPAGPVSISEGVWYSIVGTGGDFTVSTCSAYGFDTEISVSEGSCGSLTWVGGNDDFCGLGSEYTFTSVAGTTYFIYVGDYSTDLTNDNSGTFDLSITCTTPPCDATAGALIADASPVTLEGGSAVISATAAGLVPFVPAGYSVLYVLTEGAGLVIIDAAATPSFTVTAAGDYTIHTLVYDPNTLDVSSVVFGTTTGFDVNGLLIQGGGTICGALDVAGAPIVVEDEVCDATAGTLTADASPVTLVGGSATISATEGTAPFVPAGYSVLYVLTEGAGLVIINAAATPSFTVNATGDYTIHTLVYDPTTLDVSSVVFGTTTGFDVNGLLIQGGGTICGALDVAGAPIVVDEVVGLSESLNGSLSVYPNPSNGQFIVELNGAEGVGTLNIMDMMGRRVYTAGVNFTGSFRQSIDLNVAEGTYVLQVITENGIATRKVELN